MNQEIKKNRPNNKPAATAGNKNDDGEQNITLVIELGETPPKRPPNEDRQKRPESCLYLLSQWLLVVLTFGAICIAIRSLDNLKGSVDAANRQATATEEGLRPWVSAVDDIRIVQPLTLDFTQPNQTVLKYTLDIPLKNFGKSPATKVVPTGVMIWGSWKEIQGRLQPLSKYQCGPSDYLDLMQRAGGGTFIPPEGQIFYPYPAAQGRFGKDMILKQGTPVQFWLVVCVAYDNPNDIPPSLHHTCTVEGFRSGVDPVSWTVAKWGK